MTTDSVIKPIFKICTQHEWQEAVRDGFYRGSELDLKDGFIHLSTLEQVKETAQLYFKGIDHLVLVAVDPSGLEIKYEESRHGQMFPHLFSDLPVKAALHIQPISLDENRIPIITIDMLTI